MKLFSQVPFALQMGVLGLVLAIVSSGQAAIIDSAVTNLRIYNDDASSTLTVTNNYPAEVEFSDTPTGTGFANFHNFHLADAGVRQGFDNAAAFSFAADFSLSGAGEGEGGLLIAPWWSPNLDGKFNFRTSDGEIAVFGGRLPFYSFTGSHSLNYTKGDTVRVGVDYLPNSLNSSDPGTIEYKLTLGGTDYTSGPLAFDQGNLAEGPVHGLWGILDDASVGGYMQVLTGGSGAGNNLTANWSNISIVPEPSSILLVGMLLAGVVIRRRTH